jgi:hypothetical protein
VKPESSEISSELKRIENDIQALKILVVKSRKTPRKVAKLEGLLKNVQIEEADIKAAKKSIFKFSG